MAGVPMYPAAASDAAPRSGGESPSQSPRPRRLLFRLESHSSASHAQQGNADFATPAPPPNEVEIKDRSNYIEPELS